MIKKLRYTLFSVICLLFMIFCLSNTNVYAKSNSSIPETKPRLIYGNEKLADKDAFVIIVYGDGFTANEQDKFYDSASTLVKSVMDCSPWDEFTDTVKFYALGVVSRESGCRGDRSSSEQECANDRRDTYFQSHFWTNGVERLVTIDDTRKADELTSQYKPEADNNIILVNSQKYGGAGGMTCVLSLNEYAPEVIIHELGHTIADLKDEYYAGDSCAGERANMTRQSDPNKVPWSRFIGKNGIGVYPYDENNGWYRPSRSCKMCYLGKDHPFCEVCKEEIRKAICKKSNVTKLFFQTYADQISSNNGSIDIKDYFILRRGNKEVMGKKVDKDLELKYFNAKGEELEGEPSEPGQYIVEGYFKGNDEFAPYSLRTGFEISHANGTVKKTILKDKNTKESANKTDTSVDKSTEKTAAVSNKAEKAKTQKAKTQKAKAQKAETQKVETPKSKTPKVQKSDKQAQTNQVQNNQTQSSNTQSSQVPNQTQTPISDIKSNQPMKIESGNKAANNSGTNHNSSNTQKKKSKISSFFEKVKSFIHSLFSSFD